MNMPDATPAEVLSVSELTGHIKAVIEGTFPSVWVAGEIANLSRPRSGHVYLTLKDDEAQIRGVIWRSTAARLPLDLDDGQAVICCGDLDVYAARGSYQIVIRKIEPQGIGALQLAFARLQAKLNAEGLFSAERKRPLPRYPRRVAVVTSPSGAAVRDFLRAAANRWQGVEIVVVPAVVQGESAAASIVAAINAAQRLRPLPDVILLTRGGGSLEDLWCFNEEKVVRAVAASTIPTVSAVGHEVDITLCDLAADVRALTPTDGATKILPDAAAIAQSTAQLRRRLDQAIRQQLQQRRERLNFLSERTALRKPHELIHRRWRLLDELDGRARRAIRARLQLARAGLSTMAASLAALSPLDVLSRGYSVTSDLQGRPLQSTNGLQPGQVVQTRLEQGSFESIVKEID